MLKSYEKQLIEGLSFPEALNLVNTINKINNIVGLKTFGKKEE